MAFLHAIAATTDIHMRPPQEFYDENNKHIVWRLNKAMYGLRSSPKQWQDHIATVLTKLGLTRLKTDSNVYRNKEGTAYIMIYVDDLLLLGEGHIIDKIFEQIEKEVLLRPTGELQPGATISFVGRKITHNGNSVSNCNPAPTPCSPALKTDTNTEQPLNTEEHKAYSRTAGKIQWLAYTRPDICFAAKELARSL